MIEIPKTDYEWLAEIDDTSSVAGASDLKVRLDGLFSPAYSEAYMSASRELMPRARELAIPILYLQRHTLELIVKGAIKSLLSAREEMRLGYQIFGLPADADVIDRKDWKTDWMLVHRRHEFDPLFDCLTKNLKLLGLPELPDDFFKAKTLIHDLDKGDGTLLRYDTVKATRTHSFDYDPDGEPKVARIGELAALLETIASVHSRLGEPYDEPVSFLDHICQHSLMVNEGVLVAIERLEERTRCDEVRWTATRTPPLNISKHEDLGQEDEVQSVYLTAEYDGRSMVILRVPSSGDYPNFLACRHDGVLSRLLWLLEYDSNLAHEAVESMKRHRSASEPPSAPRPT